MRIRVLTIVSVGITIGLLLGMGLVPLLRALLNGNLPGLEIAFTTMTLIMAAALLAYVVKTTR